MDNIFSKVLVLYLLNSPAFPPKYFSPFPLKNLLCISHCNVVIDHKKQTANVTVIKETKLPFVSIYILGAIIFKIEKKRSYST